MIELVIVDGWWYPLNIDKRIRPIYEINTDGVIRNKLTKKILKPFIDKDGYLRYTLQGKGKKIKFYAHRLVAMKFVEGDWILQVNHKDANKKHNNYRNLEWVTNRENIQHSLDNKLQTFVRGDNHGNTIISEKEVVKLCKLIKEQKSNKEIIQLYDNPLELTNSQISSLLRHIRKGNSWRHISKNYF